MPNRCVICNRNTRKGICTFGFPKDDYVRSKWVKFVNRSADWTPTIYSRLCEDHFKESDLVRHKNKTLHKSANVIPSERTELEISTIPASLHPKVDPPRKKPRQSKHLKQDKDQKRTNK